jgi:hypothetical protein
MFTSLDPGRGATAVSGYHPEERTLTSGPLSSARRKPSDAVGTSSTMRPNVMNERTAPLTEIKTPSLRVLTHTPQSTILSVGGVEVAHEGARYLTSA